MKTLVIIPSRLSATRLPGKPLLKVNGLSIISHVFKRAERANIGEVVVATEDQEIFDDARKSSARKMRNRFAPEMIIQCVEAAVHSGDFDTGLKVRSMIIPDIFIDQDTPDKMYGVAGLDNLSIIKKVEETLNSNVILAKNKNKISS